MCGRGLWREIKENGKHLAVCLVLYMCVSSLERRAEGPLCGWCPSLEIRGVICIFKPACLVPEKYRCRSLCIFSLFSVCQQWRLLGHRTELALTKSLRLTTIPSLPAEFRPSSVGAKIKRGQFQLYRPSP